MSKENTIILILGMHRSGTSALTGVLEQLGVHLGCSLLSGIIGVNDKGFFEHESIVDQHNKILNAMGRNWMDLRPMPDNWWQNGNINVFSGNIIDILLKEFSGEKLFGIKDPRLCRLMPLWLDVLESLQYSPKVILCFRHPFVVANSLQIRDQLDFEVGILLWLSHVLESEKYSRNLPRSVLLYDDLMTDWELVCNRVSEEIDIKCLHDVSGSKEAINQFLDRKLQHADFKMPRETSSAAMQALELYENIKCNNMIDEKLFDLTSELFNDVLSALNPYLELLNTGQGYREVASRLKRSMYAEKKNAEEQISYRDALISDLNEQVGAEKKNAEEQISYRDALISDLNEQVGTEKKNEQDL
ncbi:MAG: sulfotransferase family protein [Methylophagaceae bacterium]